MRWSFSMAPADHHMRLANVYCTRTYPRKYHTLNLWSIRHRWYHRSFLKLLTSNTLWHYTSPRCIRGFQSLTFSFSHPTADLQTLELTYQTARGTHSNNKPTHHSSRFLPMAQKIVSPSTLSYFSSQL